MTYIIYDREDAISSAYSDETLARLRACELEMVFHRTFTVQREESLMSSIEKFVECEVTPESLWNVLQNRGYNGYDVMEVVERKRWKPISSWGSEGWDLGSWPYEIVFFRTLKETSTTKGTFEVAHYIEGDVTCYSLPNREARYELVNAIAFDSWKLSGCDWVEGYETVEDAPASFKGPYRR